MIQVVPFNTFHRVAQCPHCEAWNRKYSTHTNYETGIRWRYHRCENCNDTYKSCEIDADKHRNLRTVLSQVLTGKKSALSDNSIAV